MSSRVLLSATVLLAAGCATAPPLPNARMLEATQRDTLKTVETVVLVPKGGLSNDYVIAATPNAGLVAMAFDVAANNARKSEAFAAAAPLRDALGPFDYGAVCKQHLDRELAAQTTPGFTPATVSVEPTKDAREQIVLDTGADAVLLLDTAYFMSKDQATLTALAKVSLLPKPAPQVRPRSRKQKQAAPATYPPTDLHNAVYYNTITVQSTIEPIWGPNENRERWLANGAAHLRRMLPGQIAELARLAAADLKGEPITSAGEFKATRGYDGTLKSSTTLK
jgi:hypothetical protein